MLSWICNLWLFLEEATGVSVPLGVGTQYLGFHSNQALSRVDVEIGVFGIVARSTRVTLEFQCETSLLLMCDGNVGIPLQTKRGNGPSSRDDEGKKGSLLELWRETRCSSRVEMSMSGTS